MKKFSLVLALAVTVLFAQTAFADLVTNGGFEDGDFTGWTPSGDSTWAFVDNIEYYPPHSGTYAATFGSIDSNTPNVITQNLTTTPGQSYILSFWLANEGGHPSKFAVDFDGTHYTVNPDAFGWTKYSYTVTTPDESTLLSFSFYQVPAFFHLDDVSVSAVPIPGSLVLLASALLPLGWRRLRKG